MTSPSADLSKLRINRDIPPPALPRAMLRTLVLGLAALVLIGGGILFLRRGRTVPVQVVIAAPMSAGGGAGAGVTSVSVLASFLAESALIAIVGGVLGALLALPINGIVTSTTNWANFSEIAFAFRVTPALLLAGLVFAVVMGLVGGFFPARRAAKLPVVQALRG